MNSDVEDTLCRVRNRVPEAWRELLNVLGQDQAVCKAELWLQTNPLSPHSRSWDALVDSLAALEPSVINGSLQFQPVLLSLPRGMQVSLMAFLHLHQHSISTTSLQVLLKEAQPFLDPGTWSATLHSLIAGSVEREGPCTSATDVGPGKPACHINHGYTFSQRNAAMVSHVYQTLRTVMDSSPWQPHNSGLRREVEDEKETGGSEDREDIEMMEAAASAPAEESMECIVLEDDSEEDSTQSCQSLADRDRKTAEVTALGDLPSTHVSEKDPAPPAAPPGDRNSAEATDRLCPMTLAAGRLREHWLGRDAETQPPPEIQIFLTHSPQQVERLLQGLQVEAFPDAAWAQMTQDVMGLSPAISYTILVLFFSHTVVPQFVELNQAAPRVLVTCLTSMAESFPKQLIDAICSGLKGRELNAAQVDLLTLLSKDKFTKESHLYLLQQLVASEMGFSEQTASLLQGLLPQPGELEGSTVAALLSCLASAAPAMAASTQYGKLLLHLVSRLGRQLTGGQLSMLQLCVDCHKTFMKKSVNAALKRLTK